MCMSDDWDGSVEYAYLDGTTARRRGEPFLNGASIIYKQLRQEWERGWMDEDHILRTGF